MAYVDRQSGTSRATSVVIVGIVHAALGAALIFGLAPPLIDIIKPPPPPDTFNVKEKVDPPPPDQPVDDTKKPDSTVTAPDTNVLIDRQDTVKVDEPIDYPPLPPAPTAGSDKVAIYIPPTPPRFIPKPPRPANDVSRWVTNADYPASEIRREHSGTTRYRLVISTLGKVTGCEIVRSSGWTGLDEATCNYVSKRAKFEPGTDSSGAKAVDTYTGSVTWQIPE